MGEGENAGLRLHFDGYLRLEFRGAKVTSDAGLLAVRELDAAMGLTEMAGYIIHEARSGRNVRHQLAGLLRQSVNARLAGYEDVNDQEALTRDPAIRAVVGKKALERNAASSQTVSRFETDILAQEENIEALALVNSVWVDKAVSLSTTRKIVLDMYSSEFPVHGNQEGSSYNGHLLKPKSRQYLPLRHLAVVPLRVCLALFILAYNLGNFVRRFALPKEVSHWSLRSIQLKLIKIGAKAVSHVSRTIFRMAEVAVSEGLFCERGVSSRPFVCINRYSKSDSGPENDKIMML